MPESEFVVENADIFATNQAVWVLGSPIGILNDGVEREYAGGRVYHGFADSGVGGPNRIASRDEF
jgi:hypothetical protein